LAKVPVTHPTAESDQTGQLDTPIVGIAKRLTEISHVIGALLLRDMRTRAGSSHLGYLLALVGPFGHIVFLVTLYTVLGRTAPLGTDTVTFLALGVLPFVMFSYPHRQVMRSLTQNRPLLYFPRVKSLDVVLARAILEVLTSCTVCTIVIAVLTVSGYEFQPFDFAVMLAGFASAIYIGVSLGFLGAIIGSIWPPYLFAAGMFSMVFYFTSGPFYLPDLLPDAIRNVLWFNPLLHSTELVRMGYYAEFRSTMLSIQYLLWFPTVALASAFVLEFLFRRLILTK
jgi:capsular polysaccharide transport system permease protein